MGRDVYEAAMADPDSLVDVVGQPGIEDCFFEEFGYIASRVLEEKGVPKPDVPSGRQHPLEPVGERPDDADLPRRFPKLWAKFGYAEGA
jgi:hypothetical protein